MTRIKFVRAMVVLAAFTSAGRWAVPAEAAVSNRALVLEATVTGGSSSIEAIQAAANGLEVDIVDGATWSGMTAAQFASYRLIILGDPTCYGPGTTPDIDAASSNAKTWGPVINGNIVITGTDPVYHASQGGETLTRRSIDFATAQTDKTGAYISLSCYYHDTSPGTPVPLLDGIGPGGFTVTGVGCYNNAHIVATHPALAGLTDADLSNWSCSVHEAFQTWPGALLPLAIARDFDSSYTASDGSQGPPYILAGGDIKSFPLSLSPLTASGVAGSTHTVTAELLDGTTREPVARASIGFSVTAGPNTGASGVCVPSDCLTNSVGRVSWTYSSNGTTGDDTIQAFYDQSGDAVANIGEPQTTAGMRWVLTAKTLLGLGDSIAAGHGLGPSNGFPDNANSYPMLLASSLGYAGKNYAISGACAASPNEFGGSPDTPAECTTSVLSDELPFVSTTPDVITLTVGANDIRFADCFKAVFRLIDDNPCEGETFNTRLKALSSNLHLLFRALKARFPGVPIFTMKYYQPLPSFPAKAEDICPAYRVLAVFYKQESAVKAFLKSRSYDEQVADLQGDIFDKSIKIIQKLNKTIHEAAVAEGVTWVASNFATHDLCRTLTGGSVSDQWVYGLSLHGYVKGSGGGINKTIRFDYDLPDVCPSPHEGDSEAHTKSDSGRWDRVNWEYSFTGKVNCMPHPTIDGQRAIAQNFKDKILE